LVLKSHFFHEQLSSSRYVKFSEIMLAWQNENPRLLEEHSVDVCRLISRTTDGLEQHVQDTFSAVPIDILRKGVESVSFSLQKCGQTFGACVEI
jgi:hypothetical protein